VLVVGGAGAAIYLVNLDDGDGGVLAGAGGRGRGRGEAEAEAEARKPDVSAAAIWFGVCTAQGKARRAALGVSS
jgi:hypothetical protein